MKFLALVEGNFFSGLELNLKFLALVEGNFFSGSELNLKFLALVEGNHFSGLELNLKCLVLVEGNFFSGVLHGTKRTTTICWGSPQHTQWPFAMTYSCLRPNSFASISGKLLHAVCGSLA